MLRSMYSGISGMKNFQTKLDVVGNNIANVNTVGFKKGRITFQDLMSQTSSPAQGATDNRGGVNAIQVGTGAQIGSIDNVHTQGFKQNTERPLDIMLEGDGFFVVNIGDGTQAYTRAGNFSLDDHGTLVNANGYKVMGSTKYDEQSKKVKVGTVNNEGKDQANKPTPPKEIEDLDEIRIPDTIEVDGKDKSVKSFSILKDGTVQVIVEDIDTPLEVGKIGISQFSNDDGLEKAGENLWLQSDGSGYPQISGADENGAGAIESGALEMSNVDLSEEFTEMITAQRGFQANTRIITTSDEILQELVNLKR